MDELFKATFESIDSSAMPTGQWDTPSTAVWPAIAKELAIAPSSSMPKTKTVTNLKYWLFGALGISALLLGLYLLRVQSKPVPIQQQPIQTEPIVPSQTPIEAPIESAAPNTEKQQVTNNALNQEPKAQKQHTKPIKQKPLEEVPTKPRNNLEKKRSDGQFEEK